MRLVRWVALAGILIAAGTAQAGTISPALRAQMDRTARDLPISAIVNLVEQAPIAQLNQQLKVAQATRQERHLQVLTALQTTVQSQEPLRAYLDEGIRSGSVLGYTSYWISNLLVVQATPEEIERIAARPDVDIVEPNFTARLIEPIGLNIPQISDPETGGLRAIGVPPGIRAINAPRVWYELHITGAGRLVANLDTGVDGTHPALQTRWRGYNGQEPWQECWLDLLGTGTTSPVDTYGHGTHVMGTITGQAPNDSVGVSPGSKWIACNAINQGVGGEFDNDVLTAFQWFADPDGNPGTVDDVPDVVQNSWGINESFGYPDCDSRWWGVLDNCAAAGVVVTWSAGNEGSGAQTMRSPADRAATLTEAFSVGAVDATHYSWPYPIADWSSRGPTGCSVPPERKIKPEVAAPGVNVYSSIPGGGYSDQYSGTSMAGPHVAGIVGLLRQANPNLAVDDAKQILMDTARDEGTTGEDNTYGWGFVDAYQAVLMATHGFGTIQGTVTNASWHNTPIQGVSVKILQLGNTYTTNALGFYQGSAAAGTYALEASHPAFQPDTALVIIRSNEVTVQNFALVDITGPTITNVTDNKTTNDTTGPYPIQATVEDLSTVASVKLYYRVNHGLWTPLDMTLTRGVYSASIPGMPAGIQIDYYVWARDGIGLTNTSPADAPTSFYSLYVTEVIYAYNVEDPGDPNWQLGAQGDNATTGIWIRDDPVGTTWNGQPVQPEDDHTPSPGVKCFVTGNDTPGDPPGDNDVDGGCTTLVSPNFDITGATLAFFTYYRWYGMTGNSADDQFEVDASSDNGTTWVVFELVPQNDATWRKVTRSISEVFSPLPSQVKFRFRACDLGSAGLIEAAIDDAAMEVFIPNPGDVAQGGAPTIRTELAQNQPNPFNPITTIRFRLSNPAQTRIEIFDAAGQLIRTLTDEPMTAGAHEVIWNCLDDLGRPVGSGVYFYRLKAGAFEQSRRMTLMK